MVASALAINYYVNNETSTGPIRRPILDNLISAGKELGIIAGGTLGSAGIGAGIMASVVSRFMPPSTSQAVLINGLTPEKVAKTGLVLIGALASGALGFAGTLTYRGIANIL